MAITQGQFDANFTTRDVQIKAFRDAVNRLCSKWDNIYRRYDPSTDGASSQVTLAGAVADLKAPFNGALDEVGTLLAAIERVP